MPIEIKVTPGTPDSNYSALSGTTGFLFDINNTKKHLTNSNGKSMFKSVLPEMASETEECSIDRSTFTWTAYQQSHDSVDNLQGGKGGGKSNDNNLIKRKLLFGSPSSKNSKLLL
jgi:hypothetical protein